MLEIIESNYTRRRYEEIGFRLSDEQKAALIWNKPKATLQERLSALAELASKTENDSLKRQIGERAAYEEKAMKQFKASVYGETLYVVIDGEEGYACGYFGKYDTALSYAERYISVEKTRCTIEKHMVINGENIPLVKTSFRVNPAFSAEKQEELVEYSGDAVACLYLNENARISDLWSNELSGRDDEKVDEYRKDRFEYRFLPLPCVHREGLPVKYLPTGEYGVVATSTEEWDRFLEMVDNGAYADFSDTTVTVYFLTEKGCWSHEHCNPVYLEAEMPETRMNDEKGQAFCRAVEAMSVYLGGRSDEAQETLILRATRGYAEICERMAAENTGVKGAQRIDDIIC